MVVRIHEATLPEVGSGGGRIPALLGCNDGCAQHSLQHRLTVTRRPPTLPPPPPAAPLPKNLGATGVGCRQCWGCCGSPAVPLPKNLGATGVGCQQFWGCCGSPAAPLPKNLGATGMGCQQCWRCCGSQRFTPHPSQEEMR